MVKKFMIMIFYYLINIYYLVHWDEIRTGYQPFNVFIESELSERMFNFFSTPEFKTEIIANIHSCNYCERLFKKTVDN